MGLMFLERASGRLSWGVEGIRGYVEHATESAGGGGEGASYTGFTLRTTEAGGGEPVGAWCWRNSEEGWPLRRSSLLLSSLVTLSLVFQWAGTQNQGQYFQAPL